MIPASRPAQIAAVVLALAAHGMLAFALQAPVAPRLTDRAGSDAEVQLGTDFQDMAQGTLTAVPVDEAAQTEAVTPPRSARAATATPALRPPTATPTVAAPIDAGAAVRTPVLPAARPKPALPMSPEAFPESAATKPERADIQSPEDASSAPVASTRPAVRPTEFETRHAKPAIRQAKPAPPPRGNAPKNAVAGAMSDTPAAPAQPKGRNADGQQSGNAGSSNYEGVLMACVKRTSARFTRGARVGVRFSVSEAGTIQRVSVARSSGSGRTDMMAIRAIRAAGPCPPPPTGARRDFLILIEQR